MLQRKRTVARTLGIVAGIALFGSACDPGRQQTVRLTEEDREAVRSLHESYRAGWLANDPAAVMATFDGDAVLLPHHGTPAIEGAAAIRQFWWPPDAAPATVTEFTTQIDEIIGSGDLGYARGRFTLSFEYEGQTYSNSGNFFEISRKRPDGEWRIFRRIWNDPVPEVR